MCFVREMRFKFCRIAAGSRTEICSVDGRITMMLAKSYRSSAVRMISLTDFASVYMALAGGIDPLTSPHVADLRDRTH